MKCSVFHNVYILFCMLGSQRKEYSIVCVTFANCLVAFLS